METERALVKRDEFSAAQSTALVETAATAVAAREKAATEARYIVALKRPRDMEAVRIRLLKECERPPFAEVARYSKPVAGTKIEGPSIRFAEVALRTMGNVYPEQSIVFEDDTQRIIRVTVTDLESNVSYSSEILVKKTVERRQPKQGQEVISARENSTGQKVFLVYATEDELQNKQNALISKAIRNNGLRLVPGDIIEECMAAVLVTQRTRDKEDPDAAKRKVIDAFASVGIDPADLQAYLGHNLDKIQPAELADLRSVYAAIRDGETTFDAVMEERPGQGAGSMSAAAGIAERKIAAAKAKAATGQAGSTPAAASTVSGGQEAGDSPMGSGEQSGKSQPEEPPYTATDEDLPPELKGTAAKQSAVSPDNPTEEQMRQWEREALEKEQASQKPSPLPTPPTSAPAGKLKFGRRP